MSVMATVHASEATALEIEPAERRKVPTAPNPYAATLAVLKVAEAWLSDPGRWTTGCFWRDRTGNEIKSVPSNVCRVGSTCAAGAIRLNVWPHGGSAEQDRYDHAVRAVASQLDNVLAWVNDFDPDGYQKIMAAFRSAINKLEQAA